MKLKIFLASLFILLAFVGYKTYTETKALKSVDSYDSCITAKGSIIQTSYPATCVTRLGSRFTQTIATPLPSPTFNDSSREVVLLTGKPIISSIDSNQQALAWNEFTINYPTSWVYNCDEKNGCVAGTPDHPEISLTGPDKSAYIYVERIQYKNSVTFVDLVATTPPKEVYKDIATRLSYTTSTVGNYTIYKTRGLPAKTSCTNEYITDNHKRFINFGLCDYSTSMKAEYERDLDKIISTFKFTN